MPNWCAVNISINADEKTKKSITDLIVREINGNKEVDFEIVAPVPEAIKGILSATDSSIVLNRAYENRKGELNLEGFMNALNNQVQYEKPNPIIRQLFQQFGGVEDEGIGEAKPVELTAEQKEHIKNIESAVSSEIEQSDIFTLDTPVEDIIEVMLTKQVNEVATVPYDDAVSTQIDYVRSKFFSDDIIYLIEFLEQDIELYCEKKFRAPNQYYWQSNNWGSKWNGGTAWETYDYVICFDTAWNPPTGWFDSLAIEIENMGLKDYSITMKYVEPGNWFGGEIYNENGEIYSCELDDDEIREFAGIEEEDEEDEDI